MTKPLTVIAGIILCQSALAGFDATPYPSGGEISKLQASYDLNHVAIHLTINPVDKTIAGYADLQILPLSNRLQTLELDLIDVYHVKKAWINDVEATFKHNKHKLFITIPASAQTETKILTRIEYDGKPPEAKNPPWEGGFNWSHDKQGNPWIGVSCQGEGGKLWWPSKDHLSDKPDSADMYFTVPKPLIAVSNGTLEGIIEDRGEQTYHWKTRYPINNYNITLNVGAFKERKKSFHSLDSLTAVYYVLPESEHGADSLLNEAESMLLFYTKHFGQYPYAKEKFGLVQTNYWGMEHQTIISYGNQYAHTNLGYDFLLLHEMAHEWWGNYLTANEWSDLWLHEGISVYAEGLFIEDNHGHDDYLQFFPQSVLPRIENDQAIVPMRNATSSDVYTSDVYFKGAYVIHMLRYLMGKDAIDTLLFRLIHDQKPLPGNHINTADFKNMVSEYYSSNLRWFYDQYLYSKELPILSYGNVLTPEGLQIKLQWKPKGFRMPVEILLHGKNGTSLHKLAITDTPQTFIFPDAESATIDPDRWLLFRLNSEHPANKKRTIVTGILIAGLLALML